MMDTVFVGTMFAMTAVRRRLLKIQRLAEGCEMFVIRSYVRMRMKLIGING